MASFCIWPYEWQILFVDASAHLYRFSSKECSQLVDIWLCCFCVIISCCCTCQDQPAAAIGA
jgi:hypothetical protein